MQTECKKLILVYCFFKEQDKIIQDKNKVLLNKILGIANKKKNYC